MKTAKDHAIELVKRLTNRPVVKDENGELDILEDEKQCISIVEQYIQEHRFVEAIMNAFVG